MPPVSELRSRPTVGVIPQSVNRCDGDAQNQEESQLFKNRTLAPSDPMPFGFPLTLTDQLASKVQELYKMSKKHTTRFYEICWHELSMDPRTRGSPWSPPVENEVRLNFEEVIRVRVSRIYLALTHSLALWGLLSCLTAKLHFYTYVWASFLALGTIMALTGGAHRLWSHSAYKAKWPLRLLMAVFQTVALQKSILTWARVHRAHHKFVDTDGDPHNAKRGLFFSHIGWLCILPHPEALKKRKAIDTSDIEGDWIVKYQYKYYVPLSVLLCYVIPTLVPWYFWGEDFWMAHLVAGHLRHVYVLNVTFLVNSAAHKWGTKPYDTNIDPADNWLVSFLTTGEGWHNYHHVFPWDYKCAELGNYTLNMTTAFLDFCAWAGLIYDLKTVSVALTVKRILRTGDGSHSISHRHEGGTWGWTDKDSASEEKRLTLVTNKKCS